MIGRVAYRWYPISRSQHLTLFQAVSVSVTREEHDETINLVVSQRVARLCRVAYAALG